MTKSTEKKIVTFYPITNNCHYQVTVRQSNSFFETVFVGLFSLTLCIFASNRHFCGHTKRNLDQKRIKDLVNVWKCNCRLLRNQDKDKVHKNSSINGYGIRLFSIQIISNISFGFWYFHQLYSLSCYFTSKNSASLS